MRNSPPNNSRSGDQTQPRGDVVGNARCTHCGLPVPRGLIEPDGESSSAAMGAGAVYEMIHGMRLGSLLSLARGCGRRADAGSDDGSSSMASSTTRCFAELYYQPADSDGTRRHRTVPGRVPLCGLCVAGREAAAGCSGRRRGPAGHPPIAGADSLGRRRSEPVADRPHARFAGLSAPSGPGRQARERSRRREDHRFLIRTGRCRGAVQAT